MENKKKKKEECGIEYALEIKYVFMSHVKYILFSMCENKEKQCGMEWAQDIKYVLYHGWNTYYWYVWK